MLALLESDQYSSSLKTVIEKGKEEEVLRALDQQIKRFDSTIRDLCTTFYQVFGTIEDLTPLKERVSSLKEQMSELGDRVREIRREFQVNSRLLQDSWSVAHNSDIARSVLEQCLALSLMVNELEKHVKSGQMCDAVGLIQRIKLMYLGPLGHIELVRYLGTQVLRLESDVEGRTGEMFNEWLSSAWEKVYLVGHSAFSVTRKTLCSQTELIARSHQQLLKFRKSVQKRYTELSSSENEGDTERRTESDDDDRDFFDVGNASSCSQTCDVREILRRKTLPPTSIFTFSHTIKSTDCYDYDKVESVDIMPLYTAVFIYRRLGKANVLAAEYEKAKRAQADKIFTAPPRPIIASTSSTTSSLVSSSTGVNRESRLLTTLKALAGFFLIESEVALTAPELLPYETLQDIWGYAVGKCKAVILSELNSARSCSDFALVLECIVLFSESVRKCGYDVGAVLDFLPESSRHYAEIAFEEFSLGIKGVLDMDDGEPLHVSTADELEIIREHALPCEDSVPQTMGFSFAATECCRQVKLMIDRFFTVAEFLGEVDHLVGSITEKCIQSFCIQSSAPPPLYLSHQEAFKLTAMRVANSFAIKSSPQHFREYIAQRCQNVSRAPQLSRAPSYIEEDISSKISSLEELLSQYVNEIYRPASSSILGTSVGLKSHDFVQSIDKLITTLAPSMSCLPINVARRVIARVLSGTCKSIVDAFCIKDLKKINYSVVAAVRQDFILFSGIPRKAVPDRPYESSDDSQINKIFEQYLTLMNCFAEPDIDDFEKVMLNKDRHQILQNPQLFSLYLFKIAEDKSTPPSFSRKRSAFKKYKGK